MKFRKPLLALLVVFFALSNIVILYGIYNQTLAPSQSSAATDGKLLIKLVSPTTLTSAANNSTITLGLYAQNTTNSTAAEIAISYDPNVLQGTQISEDSNILLALNKHFDNTAGKATVDIAYVGSGSIPADTTLVTFDFKVIDNTKSTSSVSIANGSTLGIPNTLTTSGMGTLPISFGTTTTPPVVQPVCGNGTKETGEQCDDGNTNNSDGCSSTCTIESTNNDGGTTNNNGNTGSNSNSNTGSNTSNQNNDNGTTTPTTDNSTTTNDTTTTTPTQDNSAVIPTTTATASLSANQAQNTASALINQSTNRNVLIVVLIMTVSGTLISLFLLIRELFIKKVGTPNANPFM